MSEERLARFETQLDGLLRLAPWMKILVLGAFTLGVWATTMQIRLDALDARVSAIEEDRHRTMLEYRQWREDTTKKLERLLTLMEAQKR